MTITRETVDANAVSSRRMKVPRRSRFDFWLDLTMLIAVTLDYSFRFTGLSVHEWIGLIFVVVLPVHLTQHWNWVVRTTRRLRQRWRQPSRETLRWTVDLALLPSMTLCVASGILISRSALPTLGLHPSRDGFWTGLHTTTADVTIALVALHVALSWRWALSIVRRLVGRRVSA